MDIWFKLSVLSLRFPPNSKTGKFYIFVHFLYCKMLFCYGQTGFNWMSRFSGSFSRQWLVTSWKPRKLICRSRQQSQWNIRSWGPPTRLDWIVSVNSQWEFSICSDWPIRGREIFSSIAFSRFTVLQPLSTKTANNVL